MKKTVFKKIVLKNIICVSNVSYSDDRKKAAIGLSVFLLYGPRLFLNLEMRNMTSADLSSGHLYPPTPVDNT